MAKTGRSSRRRRFYCHYTSVVQWNYKVRWSVSSKAGLTYPVYFLTPPPTHTHRKATNSTLPAAAGDWTYDLLAMRQIVQPAIEPKDVAVQAEHEHAHKDSTGGQVQSRQCKGVCFVTLLLPPSGLRSFDTCCLNVFWPAVGSPHLLSVLIT